MKKKFTVILLVVFLALVLTSCELFDKLDPRLRVSFYDEEVLIKEEKVDENSLIEAPTLKLKEGYDFVGWFKDVNDESTKWDFEKDKVTGHLKLTALWQIKVNYINATNIKVENDYLVWDEIEDATYEVLINDKTIVLEDNKLLLKTYNLQPDKPLKVEIKAIKDGFTSLIEEREVTFVAEEEIEAYRVDFDPFDYDDFKELNRASFKDAIINHDDHYLEIKRGRLTREDQEPKTGTVALVLRDEGVLELKEGYDNFSKLIFNLGNFQNRISTSFVEVYLTNNPLASWKLAKTFKIAGKPDWFVESVLLADEVKDIINLEETVYIKFVANVEKDNPNIVLDDVAVYQKVLKHFTVNIKQENIPLSDYYKTAENLTGKDLFEELRIIVSTNLIDVKYRDYKIIGEKADYLEGKESVVVGIYDRQELRADWGQRSQWHREHVWPNSRLGMDRVKETAVNQGSDPHNLRTIYPSTNSSRSNRYYDKTNEDNDLGHTLSGGRYYPGDKDKGDVARILMYMVVRYEVLGLTNNTDLLNNKAYTIEAAYMGLLSVLLDWHNEDPVDDFERRRNDVIFTYQNNRNPFIDHPELFAEIFNYLLEVDSNRTVNVKLYFIFEINYNDLKRKDNLN